jgi:hypothetical protein
MKGAWEIEVTDTFAGEANYSWVRRHEAPAAKTRRGDVRAIKRAAGYTGHRCRVDDYGDSVIFHPRGECVVVIASYRKRG